jgi:hypothetical protein
MGVGEGVMARTPSRWVSDLTVGNIDIFVDCFAWHDAIAVCRGNFDMDRITSVSG